jgi:hypothetical protein
MLGILDWAIDNRAAPTVLSKSVMCLRHWELILRPRAATGVLLTCAAVCSLLFASCSRSSSSDLTNSTAKAGSATTTSSTSAADGQVISAWLAAQKAFHDAALTSDPNAPELAATMVPPLLDNVTAGLARQRSAGEIGKGPTYWGTPHVTATGTAGAEVVSCIHDAEIVIVAKTGEPVPGPSGQPDFEQVTSQMQPTSSGWKMADQIVKAGKCTGS